MGSGMVEDSSGFKVSLARSTKWKPSWLDKHEVRACSETMAWSTRYSPRRWPDRAHSSSALVNWSWVSRPAAIRTAPSLRRRFGDPDSSGFRSAVPMRGCPHPYPCEGAVQSRQEYTRNAGRLHHFSPGSVLSPPGGAGRPAERGAGRSPRAPRADTSPSLRRRNHKQEHRLGGGYGGSVVMHKLRSHHGIHDEILERTLRRHRAWRLEAKALQALRCRVRIYRDGTGGESLGEGHVPSPTSPEELNKNIRRGDLRCSQRAHKRGTGLLLAGEEVGRPGGREAGHQQCQTHQECQHHHDDVTSSRPAYRPIHLGASLS